MSAEAKTAREIAARIVSDDATPDSTAHVWALLAVADAIRASMPHRDPALPRYEPDGSPEK